MPQRTCLQDRGFQRLNLSCLCSLAMRGSGTIEAHRKLAKAATAHIRRHLSDPHLSLRGISVELAVSERQLQRVLRTELDATYRELVLRLRMEEARRRLSRGESARVVAGRVGYSHASGFAKAFRRVFGKPPQEHLACGPDGS